MTTSRGISLVLSSMLVLTILAGCGQSEPTQPEWESIQPDQLTQQQQEQLKRAKKAWSDLGGTLLGRVTEVIKQDGPTEAIKVCRDEASRITDRLADKHNLKIGRTSHRLRNPENQPPEWARQMVKNKVDERRLFESSDGRLGVTQPIPTAQRCTTCHGPKERIPPNVQDQLDQHYPQDQATGFEAGDLRGWFWVEVEPET